MLLLMPDSLAIDGGEPVRDKVLPYGRQLINDDDVKAVNEVMCSDWLTTGPKVTEFEEEFASFVGTKHAVAVNSGTAALHAAYASLGIGPGDEVIVPAMTFAATANAAVFCGAAPVIVDVEPDTLLIDVSKVESAITNKTKVIAAVDYAGQPCNYDALQEIADKHHLTLVSDACHALGGAYQSRNVGSIARLSTFSFHPVKPMTTGEGGMVTTDDEDLAKKMRQFRNHCMTTEFREREEAGSWLYEVSDLGWNYRLTDIQCALGLSQLKNVPEWTAARQKIAKKYDAAFSELDAVTPLSVREGVSHAYHLYVIQLNLDELKVDRSQVFKALRAENIGVNVHYVPVHMHAFYRERFKTYDGMCPVAESAYERIISLPIFAGMSEKDADDVIEAVRKVCHAYDK